MNEEQIEDRHYQHAVRRAHEARKEAADRIVRKAEELAALMSDLGQYGITCDVCFHEVTGQVIGKPSADNRYFANVTISEPPVVLGSTDPAKMR